MSSDGSLSVIFLIEGVAIRNFYSLSACGTLRTNSGAYHALAQHGKPSEEHGSCQVA